MAFAFRSDSQSVPTQNMADDLIRNLAPQVGQGADDANIIPTGVVLGHVHDPLFHGCIHGRAADRLASPSEKTPLLGD